MNIIIFQLSLIVRIVSLVERINRRTAPFRVITDAYTIRFSIIIYTSISISSVIYLNIAGV